MFEGHLWGRIAAEVADALVVLSRAAMTDAGAPAPPGSVTARTAATADLAGASPAVDWFVSDIAPVSYRSGSDPSTRLTVIGLRLACVLTVAQPAAGAVDRDALTAFGAIIGVLHENPLRVAPSATLGGAMVLQIERDDVAWAELRDVFAASDRPLARAARFRVTVQRSTAPPDVTAPLEPARLVVIHGGTVVTRRRAAEASAGGKLAVVDLSQIESKWIGETEKNLSAVFASAQQSGAVLLFDEADALFGKRSGVRDAHDRYAALDPAALPAGTTVILTVSDPAVAKRLAARGAEVVEAEPTDPEPQ